MKNNLLESHLAEAEQPVKNFMADLIEELNKKSAFSKVPRLSLHYFGVKLEVELISFDGN
ncbi:hypothetical protein BS333_04740 [Vibrio azureus]|uniref:Uncharacterized protein n=1 Tax=Vibrio azureus NBRC 104587 TaxID=1219077 RepID=U3AM49_9VIBR|nr:hypothetical protein [Vibrio azureus]AUI85731.1 hypothetical protein BS333_04740 [Vibrio azureus]GAD74835.1 hypothetical protein VAZ01S_016_00190 [Vibrio azureus NBRC 104587]